MIHTLLLIILFWVQFFGVTMILHYIYNIKMWSPKPFSYLDKPPFNCFKCCTTWVLIGGQRMKITSDDIQWFKEAKKILSKGYYPNGQKAIEDYKRIFADEIAKGTMPSNLNPRCGSCIKTAVQKTYDTIIKLEEKLKNEERVSKED